MNDILVFRYPDGSYEVREQYLLLCPLCGRLEVVQFVDRKFVTRQYFLDHGPVMHR